MRVSLPSETKYLTTLRKTPSVSCMMPAYNEAANLPTTIAAVIATLQSLAPHTVDQFEIIVIDDGSKDDTAGIMKGLCEQHPQLVYVQLSRNFGKEAAITAALAAAKGDVGILMDSDGQHPCSLFNSMLAYWQQGVDVVYAVRQQRDDQSLLQKYLTHYFYKFINFDSKVRIPPHAGDFRLMDRKVLNALNLLPENNRFMKGLYAWTGFSSHAIEYTPLERLQGRSNYGLRGSFTLAFTGILAFSKLPLRFISYLGAVLAMCGFGFASYIVLIYLLYGASIDGWATIVVSITFFSGVQLLSIGVLAEYIGRVYEEVKQRPNFIVQHRTGQGLGSSQRLDNKSINIL